MCRRGGADLTVQILHGDALTVLRTLPANSVHCCITSPPYLWLRDYGTARWEGGDPSCDHAAPNDAGHTSNLGNNAIHAGRWAGPGCPRCGARRVDEQLGLEATPALFIERLVGVFREVRRVLRDEGVLWLNLGDSFAGSWGAQSRGGSTPRKLTRKPPSLAAYQINAAARDVRGTGTIRESGLKPKDLIGIPWRVALALQADGWWLRQWLPWVKRNPMPENVADRPTSAVETIFMLSKSADCYYDYAAVKRRASPATNARVSQNLARQQGSVRAHGGAKANGAMKAVRNRKLAKAGEGIKANELFAAAGGRIAEFRAMRNSDLFYDSLKPPFGTISDADGTIIALDTITEGSSEQHYAAFPPKMVAPLLLASCPEGGTVLDCYGGSGTVGVVAERQRRSAILIDLNADYCAGARRRIDGDAPLLRTGS